MKQEIPEEELSNLMRHFKGIVVALYALFKAPVKNVKG